MKKILILSVTFLILSLGLLAQTKKGRMDSTQHKIYTCTMHPEIKSNKPGKCPKCGMTLVKKAEKENMKD